MGFNPKREMLVGKAYRVEATIIINESAESLVESLSKDGEVKVEEIPVSTFMKARLGGSKFDILPITEERQLVARYGQTKWLWYVTPKEVGVHELTLYVIAEVALPGLEPMTIDTEVLSSKIIVTAEEVPTTEKATGFLADNWEFLVGTIIIGSGLFGWIVSRIRSKK